MIDVRVCRTGIRRQKYYVYFECAIILNFLKQLRFAFFCLYVDNCYLCYVISEMSELLRIADQTILYSFHSLLIRK